MRSHSAHPFLIKEKQMKKLHFIPCICILTICLCLFSCGQKQKKAVQKEQPLMILGSKDTVTVKKLATEFLEYLKSGNSEAAIDMLYFVTKDKKLVKLPYDLVERQRAIFKHFPVYSYKIDSIIFHTETDSQIRYTIEFFKKENGDNRSNTTSFFLRPMRFNDVWYLTLADTSNNNVGESQIKN